MSYDTPQIRSRYLILLIAFSMLSLTHSSFAELTGGHHFQAIASNEAITHTLWYYNGEKKTTIVASQIMRSEDYAYTPAPYITFYGERVDSEGSPIPEAIAKVPEGASRLLLFFNTLKEPDENGLNYSIIVLEDDLKKFPFGSFYFINACQQDTAIKISGEQFLLSKGGTEIIEIKPQEKDLGIDIATRLPESDGWTKAYSNRWGHRANLRTLVILVNTPQGRIRALRYRQTEPTQ